jgi:hypothetical protein
LLVMLFLMTLTLKIMLRGLVSVLTF